MLRTARFSGALAAVIWLVGTPVVAIAGVPFPSDAEYVYMGLLATLLGFTLAPVVLAIGEPMPSRKRTVVRLSGLVVCIALILSGVVLLAAVQGWLAEDVAHQSPSMAITVFIALFVWIGLADDDRAMDVPAWVTQRCVMCRASPDWDRDLLLREGLCFYQCHRHPHFAIRFACMDITAGLADGRRLRHVAAATTWRSLSDRRYVSVTISPRALSIGAPLGRCIRTIGV